MIFRYIPANMNFVSPGFRPSGANWISSTSTGSVPSDFVAPRAPGTWAPGWARKPADPGSESLQPGAEPQGPQSSEEEFSQKKKKRRAHWLSGWPHKCKNFIFTANMVFPKSLKFMNSGSEWVCVCLSKYPRDHPIPALFQLV